MTHQSLKSDKSSWRYTKLEGESRFQERQILAIFGVINFFQKSFGGYVHPGELIMKFCQGNMIRLHAGEIETSENNFVEEYMLNKG